MQCVILAAGEGTRMRPLTETVPKPLVPICGQPLLAHIVNALPQQIDEIILVVQYRQEQIRALCGDTWHGRRIRYVVQEDPKGGTGDALHAARECITDTFLMMYGDDIHGASALADALQHEHCMLAATSETPEKFGVLELNDDGTLRAIIEKPDVPPSNLVNIGGWVLSPDIFSYEIPRSHLNEYLLTDAITAYAKDHPVTVVKQDTWVPVGYPEDITRAEKLLCPDRGA